MSTDFFDDDLTKARDTGRRPGESGEALGGTLTGDVPVRTVSDLSLTKMAQYKQELNTQHATAVQELEKLKKRQEDLDREKRDLEELRRRQESFEQGKREMIERFNQSLVSLERDEIQTGRLLELLATVRKRFQDLLDEIRGIHEEGWPEAGFRDELNKALVVIDNARLEYNKAVARIEAVSSEAGKAAEGHSPVMFQEPREPEANEKSFGYWLKVGFAVSLPLVLTIVVVAVVIAVLRSGGLM
jgi:DNA repair exonuclease SbcCD ATPase subunit